METLSNYFWEIVTGVIIVSLLFAIIVKAYKNLSKKEEV